MQKILNTQLEILGTSETLLSLTPTPCTVHFALSILQMGTLREGQSRDILESPQTLLSRCRGRGALWGLGLYHHPICSLNIPSYELLRTKVVFADMCCFSLCLFLFFFFFFKKEIKLMVLSKTHSHPLTTTQP
ncbi:hypothetical protein HJG60_012022 [Phyllostomus discolor]|uniref:Uncharacterized protein n=1 Tax=Phyllostomus discolor TaxID=89673 RepID=A0A833ZM18_9CHIR|nr:hypothetical protein HJG60_012022 [Phyllostomus discolor]